MKTIGLAVFQAVTWVMESPKFWNWFMGALVVIVLYLTLKTIL